MEGSEFKVIVVHNQGGSVSPMEVNVKEGSVSQFKVKADEEYIIKSIEGCEGTLADSIYTTSAIRQSCSVFVEFAHVSPPLEVSRYHSIIISSNIDSSNEPKSVLIKEGDIGSYIIPEVDGYYLYKTSGCSSKIEKNKVVTPPIFGGCNIKLEFKDSVSFAILKRDHSLATNSELTNDVINKLKDTDLKRVSLIEKLYDDVDVLSYTPGRNSLLLNTINLDKTHAVMRSTHSSSHNLILAGEKNEHRYMVMGGNMLATQRSGDANKFLQNSINWLTRRNVTDYSTPISIVVSNIPNYGSYPHFRRFREWLENHFSSYSTNTYRECDYINLVQCIDKYSPDFVLISSDDYKKKGYDSLKSSLKKLIDTKIPIMVTSFHDEQKEIIRPFFEYTGTISYSNYWSNHKTVDLSIDDMRNPLLLPKLINLFESLKSRTFDISTVNGCSQNLIACNKIEFSDSFKSAADWLKSAIISLDKGGIDALKYPDDYRLISTALLLSDKYRKDIDYPILHSEPIEWLRAMFSDWTVSYARHDNLMQNDLGQYVTDKKNVKKGSYSNYLHPNTISERKTLSVQYPNQWTTTGWYALPGKKITLTRHDKGGHAVKIKLNYHRIGTNRIGSERRYLSPLDLATERLSIPAGGSVSFSTPYGGPIYLSFVQVGGTSSLSSDITAKGVAKHPAIIDFSDMDNIKEFEALIETTELPHVDLKTKTAEQHLRRDRFLGAINEVYENTSELLAGIKEDHLGNVHALAGLKVEGKSLSESLSSEVLIACKNYFNDDCTDESIHTRKIIQHANYDQNAHCGIGCSGNPWDSAKNISPRGWLDNHELGHNLQVKQLDVHYVSNTNKNDWTKYQNRAGENSNNIFPYYVAWKSHYVDDEKIHDIKSGQNHKELFYHFMSDVIKATDKNGYRVIFNSQCKVVDKGVNRYEALWKSNEYAAHNDYRMMFYIQMMLRVHNTTLSDGSTITNGFDLFPFLYLHQRIFSKYASSEEEWLKKRNSLGFSEFSYKHSVYGNGNSVSFIPGNDFILVSLSLLTGKDWTPYFDMFGLRYTDLAAHQSFVNSHGVKVSLGMFVLENNYPDKDLAENLDFLELNLDDESTVWPIDNSSPSKCI
ncbi:ImpA family metalloprotease [Vibrio hepatarius]|uniref:ImpA family metalloprotease n=1 Tax=Vibrio hepatarius TaxID=171383 RepID=UPI003736BD91